MYHPWWTACSGLQWKKLFACVRWKCVIHMTMEKCRRESFILDHCERQWVKTTLRECHHERVLYTKTLLSCEREEGLTSLRRIKMYCVFPFFTINGWSLSQLLYILATVCPKPRQHPATLHMGSQKLCKHGAHRAFNFQTYRFEVSPGALRSLFEVSISKFTENSWIYRK